MINDNFSKIKEIYSNILVYLTDYDIENVPKISMNRNYGDKIETIFSLFTLIWIGSNTTTVNLFDFPRHRESFLAWKVRVTDIITIFPKEFWKERDLISLLANIPIP